VSILSDFEDRIGRAVEGGFARVFRSPVQPAELARKLGKEMDRRKVLGVGKVYAPTLYNVLLSEKDDSTLGGFADTLSGELETYLIGYARERDYVLTTRPVVRFLVDPDLRLGRFEVIGELMSPEEISTELGNLAGDDADPIPPSARAKAVADAPPAAEHIFDAETDVTAYRMAVTPSAAERIATVTVRGVDHDVVLRGDRAVVGRLNACEICLSDVNVSREHAIFERDDDGWSIRDLGSTNGTLVNGKRVDHSHLRDGDVVVIGVTELIYHEPRG
jgi:hypothetical protein